MRRPGATEDDGDTENRDDQTKADNKDLLHSIQLQLDETLFRLFGLMSREGSRQNEFMALLYQTALRAASQDCSENRIALFSTRHTSHVTRHFLPLPAHPASRIRAKSEIRRSNLETMTNVRGRKFENERRVLFILSFEF